VGASRRAVNRGAQAARARCELQTPKGVSIAFAYDLVRRAADPGQRSFRQGSVMSPRTTANRAAGWAKASSCVRSMAYDHAAPATGT